MKNKFIKMHGLGNDFAIFDGRESGLALTPVQVRALCDRRTGIGCDQLIIILPPQSGGDACLQIYNADGGEVDACGNATRCIGHLLILETKKSVIVLETNAGKLTAQKAGKGICVDMGAPLLEWQKIPLARAEDTLSLPVVAGLLKNPVAVSMGNPHAVFFTDDVESIALEQWGPVIENDPLFPKKTNVEFATVIDPQTIRMRVWERGAGVTRACGTGACAVGVAAVRKGLAERKVTVILDGGTLDIEWRESDGHVMMTGAVAESYRGEIDLDCF